MGEAPPWAPGNHFSERQNETREMSGRPDPPDARSGAHTKGGSVCEKSGPGLEDGERVAQLAPSDRKCGLPGHVASSAALPQPQGVCSEIPGLRPKDRAARQRRFPRSPWKEHSLNLSLEQAPKPALAAHIPAAVGSWSWAISLYRTAGSQEGTTDRVAIGPFGHSCYAPGPALGQVCQPGQKRGL
uniref:Uncharacterized protein n=1 Tax=Molossus molossus TaxID=27622 RepID=A0A7J8HDV4_MOLMO|nr:hypothetical protein HJG59_011211 [Molossus molossus]